MADAEVILIDLWSSPFSMRVRIALAEKCIEYDAREDDLFDKSPLLLQMNPVRKKLPVLIHNGRPICESLIIVQYIDEIWNHKSPLLPSDPYQKAHARFWADYVDNKIYSTCKLLLMARGEVQETAKKQLIEIFKELETELGDKPYFGGDKFGIVDVALIPFYSRFYAIETFGNFSIAAVCPKLVAWAERCMQRESVSNCLPDQHKVFEYILELKKKLNSK